MNCLFMGVLHAGTAEAGGGGGTRRALAPNNFQNVLKTIQKSRTCFGFKHI